MEQNILTSWRKDMNLACFTSFQPQPVTIDSLAYSESLGLVAEGLADGSIRFLDSVSLVVTACVPGNPRRSVRRMLFYKNYLITSGVHGSASMWDLETLSEVCSVDSSQGAVWDMALKGDRLYLATETGFVVIVELSDGDMRVSGFLRSASSGRALSVCVEGAYLFVGTASGLISRWKLSTGSCDSTFSIPSKNNMPTLVWSLVACGKGVIASGDSTGTVSLWDSKSCTLLQTRQDHQADVLVMHFTENRDLYSSGVDSRVARYKLSNTSSQTEDRLGFISISALLTRDVSAMTTAGDLLLVGGSDARIGVASTDLSSEKFTTVRMDRFREPVEVCGDLVFVQSEDRQKLKVFRVSGEDSDTFLAELDNKTQIASFCVSETGSKIVLVGVDKCVRILAFKDDGVSLKATHTLAGPATCSVASDRFTVIAYPGHLLVIPDDNKNKTKIIKLNRHDAKISRLVLKGESLFAVCGKEIHHFTSLSEKKSTKPHVVTLDAYITAVSDANGSSLIVATADQLVRSLALPSLETTEWTRKISSNKFKIPLFNHVNHIVKLDDEHHCVVFGESFILTSDGKKKGFRFNSTLPTGGVILGAGVATVDSSSSKRVKTTEPAPEHSVLAVLANYGATHKALISPFERKSFQH